MTNDVRRFVESLKQRTRRAEGAAAHAHHAPHDTAHDAMARRIAGACEDPAVIARQVDRSADLRKRFVASAKATGANVHELPSGGIVESLVALLARLELRRSVWSPCTLPEDLVSRLTELPDAARTKGIELEAKHDDETMFSADAGITGVYAAVAETGSLVVASGQDQPRCTSLIPPIHLAVVGERQIIADLCDLYTDAAAASLPAALTLITGPSKTADIEGVLVTGMHGPRAVHIVLVGDGETKRGEPG